MSEQANYDQSSFEAARNNSYKRLPILIFSRSTKDLIWNQQQEALKSLSTRSRRIIAVNSDHYIQLERPTLVQKEVSLYIELIRGNSPKPGYYGSTVLE